MFCHCVWDGGGIVGPALGLDGLTDIQDRRILYKPWVLFVALVLVSDMPGRHVFCFETWGMGMWHG